MFFRAKYLPTRVARWYIFKQIWVNLEGLAVEDVGTLYFHSIDFTANLYILWQFGIFFAYLVYFLLIWYILCLFGIFYAYLVYFFPFWYVVPRKIWQPFPAPKDEKLVLLYIKIQNRSGMHPNISSLKLLNTHFFGQMLYFHTKNANYGYILDGLSVWYFCGHFGIFLHFGIFFHFGLLYQGKNCQLCIWS
jgi:hypothetical protein